MKKNWLCFLTVFVLSAASVIWISCSGGGGSSSGTTNLGTVALYATDSPDDEYTQVVLTINGIQLQNTGTGETCDVLTTPVTLDISDLSSVLELLTITSCPAENYNRIHVDISKQATLTDTGVPPATASCSLVSYKDKNNNSNMLDCSGDACSIDITGAVNVLASQENKLALDFELKDFEVDDFNTPDCSLTMKVSPLNASGIKDKHDDDDYEDEISGTVSGLDTTAKSFVLTSKKSTYSVNYGGVIGNGIDDLLTLAQLNGLKVKIGIGSLDISNQSIEATSIGVKVEGMLSGLDSIGKTFTLTYNSGSITIGYSDAESSGKIEGTLSDGLTVEAVLDSYDTINDQYSASKVEVGDANDESADDDSEDDD